MKILFIHNHYRQPGGEDTAVELETSLLKERGHQVELLVFNNENAPGSWATLKAGASAIYNRQSAATVKKAILSFRPDIIHVHNFFFRASPSIFFVTHQYRVPVVMTLHNYRLICANALLSRQDQPCELCVRHHLPFSGIRYRCYRHSAMQSALVTAVTGIHKITGTWKNKVDRFIVLTAFAREKFLHSSLDCDEASLVIQPNFVPDRGTGSHPRKDFYLFAGRISKEKGVGCMVRAFAAMNGVRLVIAGEGPDREALALQYGANENISFIGSQQREEIILLMKTCKAFVFPSLVYEGLPFVLLEAFSTGTPVIASRLGSMIEMIQDGYNGFHFTAGDAESLKKAVQQFETNPEEKQQLYHNARQTYLNNYLPAVHYDAVMQLYHETIASRQLIK